MDKARAFETGYFGNPVCAYAVQEMPDGQEALIVLLANTDLVGVMPAPGGGVQCETPDGRVLPSKSKKTQVQDVEWDLFLSGVPATLEIAD